ncbi:outer membrane biogenesis protein BamB [Posidoniimonas polymericola]|uniref:Outer membrane biogenesis protein BamB n=1 Tax=Posidoniimonas polymericola TaxID=2528002 RepID=A0A5C5YMH6_9BACT|nr:PQQ-binding-like beta-propeller repeat protein [Posidoniimonas polymericola]TWT76039.1 outer membrane biogenesis protein BamB [Posidoniimonas polymericola]
MSSLRSLFALLSLSLVCSPTRADNWPHWRGEGGNGVSTTAKPPTEWSETKNVKWKVAIPGRGSGSPIVWEDQVFVVTGVPAEGGARGALDFVVLCFNRQSGDLLWKQTATTGTPHEGTHSTNNYASASPTTDGQHVYAHFGSQGLYCFTLDGQPVWSRVFGEMRTRNEFGEGSSPTIAGDKILVPWDHEGPSFLYALDKKTGEVIWRVERDEPTNWSTPLVVEHDGGEQVVMNGQNYARSYDLKTGDELWRCDGQTQRPAASAVAMGDTVFVTSGFRGSFLGAFELDGRGDIEGTPDVLWTKSRDTPDIASPLLSNGRLYYFKAKTGILTCLDAATGEPHYASERTKLRTTYASPVAANGYVYLSDRDGTTLVIKDADEYQEVATNNIGETIDATPAPVDNQLFIRGERHLFCIADE